MNHHRKITFFCLFLALFLLLCSCSGSENQAAPSTDPPAVESEATSISLPMWKADLKTHWQESEDGAKTDAGPHTLMPNDNLRVCTTCGAVIDGTFITISNEHGDNTYTAFYSEGNLYYATETHYEFDQNGNPIAAMEYDAITGDLRYQYEYQMNDTGKRIGLACFDTDHTLVVTEQYTYDDAGNVVSFQAFDGNETLTRETQYEYETGKDGGFFRSRQTDITYYIENSTKSIQEFNEYGDTLLLAGYSLPSETLSYRYSYQFEYDASGNKTKELCYTGEEGSEIFESEIQYSYDNENNLLTYITRRYTDGYLSSETTSNAYDVPLQSISYHEDGSIFMQWEYEYTYDELGTPLSSSSSEFYYDENGEKHQSTYNSRNEEVSYEVFHTDGSLNYGSYYEYEYGNDDRIAIKKVKYISEDGSVSNTEEHYEYLLDSDGEVGLIGITYLDEDGNKVKYAETESDGISTIFSVTYDTEGNITRYSEPLKTDIEFYKDGRIVQYIFDYAGLLHTLIHYFPNNDQSYVEYYDDNGECIEKAMYSGNLIEIPEICKQ